MEITYEGAAGDYNVLADGTHIGRVRQESMRLAGRRKSVKWVAWSIWTKDGREVGPVGSKASGRCDTRQQAANALIARARRMKAVAS